MSIKAIVERYEARLTTARPGRMHEMKLVGSRHEIAGFVCRTPVALEQWLAALEKYPEVAALVSDDMLERNKWRASQGRKGAYNEAE